MKDSEFLNWIAARIVNNYCEDENIDFVLHLKELATAAKEKEDERESGYKVSLNYFRETGKFYSEGDYRTNKVHLWEIWEEVQDMLDNRKLPGLIEGHSEYSVIVDVPQHVHRHPHLITPVTVSNEDLDESIKLQLESRGYSNIEPI